LVRQRGFQVLVAPTSSMVVPVVVSVINDVKIPQSSCGSQVPVFIFFNTYTLLRGILHASARQSCGMII
jgi:hypothetical protein